MNEIESALTQMSEQMRVLHDELDVGILIADLRGERFLRANPAICRMLGYREEEMLSLGVRDIHPAESLPQVMEVFEAMSRRRLKSARDIPFRRKDGGLLYANVTAVPLTFQNRPCVLGLFRDVTEEKLATEQLRASQQRFRLIADNVGDVIWTVDFPPLTSDGDWQSADKAELAGQLLDRWRFSFVSPAMETVFGYTVAESRRLSLRDFATPATLALARQALIKALSRDVSRPTNGSPHHFLELEFRAKDGSPRWCEVLSTTVRNESGVPTAILGITRDVTQRRRVERALRESEATLRGLFENLPDFVVLVDQAATIQFANRGQPGVSRESLVGSSGFGWMIPEHQPLCREALERAIADGLPQSVIVQDVFGQWWSCRVAPLGKEGERKRAMVICADVTQERLAAEAVKKEQRLLRQMLELQERERRLVAYEIHDGFAQQLTGALYRLQAFRETLARDPARAWQDFDSSARMLARAIDETRRLISGLRPPILDELGIIEAIEYLVCERRLEGGLEIDFDHDPACPRLPPSLQNTVFRIVQELFGNACRHSRSRRVRLELRQRDGWIHVSVRDWGVGFEPHDVPQQRFGLQGVRERVRLLEGRVAIESAPNEGTHVSVELPLAGGEGETPQNH